MSAARGAGLIGVAVVLGIVLLQVIDDGTSGPAGGGGDPTVTTTDGDPTVTSNSPATTAAAARPPAQVRVLVLNAGQPAGSAGTKGDDLEAAGYTLLPPDDSPTDRAGVAVQCREGFEQDSIALVAAVGEGAQVEAFPAQPPVAVENVDCLVILGTAG